MQDKFELRGARIALSKPSLQAAATDGVLKEIIDKRGICVEASGKTARVKLGPAEGEATDGRVVACAVEARKPDHFNQWSNQDRFSYCDRYGRRS